MTVVTCHHCSVQVFVCGSYPHWVFMTEHAAMRVHPMFIDGPISSFASFNNVNCPKGFLYFNKEVCCGCVRHLRIHHFYSICCFSLFVLLSS